MGVSPRPPEFPTAAPVTTPSGRGRPRPHRGRAPGRRAKGFRARGGPVLGLPSFDSPYRRADHL
eukprot:1505010-Lingulodinium_polyedra.AAC.1